MAKTNQDARRTAAKQGQIRFKSPLKCRQCDSRERYVRSNQCVACAKRRSREQNNEFKELVDAGRAGIIQEEK